MSPELQRQHEAHKERRLRIASRAYENRPKTQDQPILEKHAADVRTVQNRPQAEINVFGGIALPVIPKYTVTYIRPVPVSIAAIHDILNESAWFYGFEASDITGDRRPADLVVARHVAMYLCHKLTQRTPQYIGRAMRKDRTSVLHGVKKIIGALGSDRELADEVGYIADCINNRAAERMRA